MKNIIAKGILLSITLFFFGCEQQDCCAPLDQTDEVIGNEWQLYETGSSTGANYLTVEVPSVQTQKVKFHEDGRLIHSIESLKDYKFYLILHDPQSDQNILSFYKTDPGNDPQDISHLEHSYSIAIEEGNLKLRYRWCKEGCHLGFKRITN